MGAELQKLFFLQSLNQTTNLISRYLLKFKIDYVDKFVKV